MKFAEPDPRTAILTLRRGAKDDLPAIGGKRMAMQPRKRSGEHILYSRVSLRGTVGCRVSKEIDNGQLVEFKQEGRGFGTGEG